MLQIGITGGIGSGKSTVCEIFKVLGVPVYDADSRAKMLMTEDSALVNKIIQSFGEEAYLSDGVLNRDYLAQHVFSNKSQLEKLNGLVHPAVGIDYKKWSSEQNAPYVIKEAALLIESGSYKQLDKLVVVSSPMELRIERIQQRDPFRSKQEIEGIIKNQLSDEERESYADYILKNDENELLIPQVTELDQDFSK